MEDGRDPPHLLAGQAWRYITEKAGDHCIAPAGAGAMEVLRIEEGLPRYGHEFNETIGRFAAGLDSAVAFNHSFLGTDALAKLHDKGPVRKLAGLVVNAPGDVQVARQPPAARPVRRRNLSSRG